MSVARTCNRWLSGNILAVTCISHETVFSTQARSVPMISRGALRRDVGAGIVSPDLSWTQYRSSGLFRSLAGLYDEVLAEMIQSGFRPRPGQQR